MARNRILAIIQAGGAGGRMDVLTRERAKPALPFAGVYQLIDFPLSNLAHSGISEVWLSLQYQASTLDDQVANGRPWDLDRSRGGLRLLMPQEGVGSDDEQGFARGNADLLFRIRDEITNAEPEAVVVMSADQVYRFDYLEAVEAHRRKDAECTIVTTDLADRAEASNHATVESNRLGRVTGFAYKPDRPKTSTVATEIFVYDPAALVTVLDDLHRERAGVEEGSDSGLGDFGESLVPRLVERGRAYAYPMAGYWRDLGQPHHYLASHLEILADDTGLFGDPDWRILTRQPQRVPARLLSGSRVENSMVSPGARVAGVVRHSVLGPGVVVEEGAVVSNSVVFADTVVEAEARIDWAIVDSGCVIGAGAKVGDSEADATTDADAVTIVGKDSRVGTGVNLGAGARLEPGTTA